MRSRLPSNHEPENRRYARITVTCVQVGPGCGMESKSHWTLLYQFVQLEDKMQYNVDVGLYVIVPESQQVKKRELTAFGSKKRGSTQDRTGNLLCVRQKS